MDKPTEGPSADATSPSDEIFTLTVSKPEEGTTLELGGETKTPENDKFIGVAVTIENSSSTSIGLDTDRFRLYDDSGTEINIRYGAFSTSGPEIPAGEEAEAQLYADVPEDTVLAEISYTDEVGTGGQEFRVPVGGCERTTVTTSTVSAAATASTVTATISGSLRSSCGMSRTGTSAAKAKAMRVPR